MHLRLQLRDSPAQYQKTLALNRQHGGSDCHMVCQQRGMVSGAEQAFQALAMLYAAIAMGIAKIFVGTSQDREHK